MITVDKATAIKFARGVAVIATVVVTIYWFAPRPPDPGVSACARIRTHTLAGTVPDEAERARLTEAFERSDAEPLQDAGRTERLSRPDGFFARAGLPVRPVDLTDISSFTAACSAAGMQ